MNKIISAIYRNDINSVNEWISAGNNINMINETGVSILMMAISYNQKEIVNKFVNEPFCNYNLQDQFGNTALIYAIKYNIYENAIQLIEHGCDLNLQNTIGNTALMYAIIEKKSGIAIRIIDEAKNGKCNLDLYNVNNMPALILAINNGQLDIVYKLIDNGCNLEQKFNDNYYLNGTAIVFAIKEKKWDLFNKLIDAKCNINIILDNSKSLVMIAIENERVPYANKLIDAGCNVNIIDKFGNTALTCALRYKYVNMIDVVIKIIGNFDINVLDEKCYNTLLDDIYNSHNEELIINKFMEMNNFTFFERIPNDHKIMSVIQNKKIADKIQHLYSNKLIEIIHTNDHALANCFRRYGDMNIVNVITEFIY